MKAIKIIASALAAMLFGLSAAHADVVGQGKSKIGPATPLEQMMTPY